MDITGSGRVEYVEDIMSNSPQWDSRQWGLPINQVDMAATRQRCRDAIRRGHLYADA